MGFDNFLSRAAGVLTKTARTATRTEITYTAPGGSPETLDAGVGACEFELAIDDEIVDSWRGLDFLVDPDDLAAEPVEGAVIDYDGDKYQVMSPGTEPVWRFTDRFRTCYRIHAKRTGST